MKGNIISATGLVLIMLLLIALLGCATSPQMTDTRSYVRQHKGEGARHSLLGSEVELIRDLEKILRDTDTYSIITEPHALFATGNSGLAEVTLAFYFSPSQENGKTDIEVLMAAPILDVATLQSWEKSAPATYFPLAYINTRLLEKGYDPNAKDGPALALSTAAIYKSREISKKLITRGADLDLAIDEQTKSASYILSLINNPDFAPHVQKLRVSYDKSNSTIEFLKGLTQFASRFKRSTSQNESEKESDARFQEALRVRKAGAAQQELPEAARRFKVQAEDAVREKKFDEAADLYLEALNIAPLWSAGHYNRALVLGETGNYEGAVREMKRYLLLAPNASNVRSAQDKIYIWERKAGEDS